MNNALRSHPRAVVRNTAVVFVLVVAVAVNQWIRNKELSKIAGLQPDQQQLVEREHANQEMEDKLLNGSSFTGLRHRQRQHDLLKQLGGLQRTDPDQWPERAWDSALPLVLIASRQDSFQFYVGDIDVALEVVIQPTENPSAAPKPELYRSSFTLPKNSWRFFDVQLDQAPQAHFLRFGLSTLKQKNLSQELRLELERPLLFSPNNDVRGIHHVADFEDGRIGPLIDEKLIRGFHQGEETSYLMRLKLRATQSHTQRE